MNRIMSLLFVMLMSAGLQAQTTETPEVVLGFSMKEVHGFTADQQNLLRSKVLEAVTAHQIGIYDYNLHFYMQPGFAVISKKTADGGLRKIEVVNARLLLSIVNAMNHQVLSAASVAVQGSGTSEEEAMTSAVNAIEPDAPAIQEFLVQSKEKIAAYYKSQCNTIVGDVNTLIAQKQYEVALVRLGTLPDKQVSCSDKLRPLKAKVLQLYQRQEASKPSNEKKDQSKETVAKKGGSIPSKTPAKGKSKRQYENDPARQAGQQQASAALAASVAGASSGSTSTGNGDPVRSIAAAILALKQVK